MNTETAEMSIEQELRRIREEMLAEYGGDVRAMLVDVQKRTLASGRKLISYDTSPPLTENTPDYIQR